MFKEAKIAILIVSMLIVNVVPAFAITPVTQITEIHVAVNGNDSNPGTIEKPLATLNGAREAVSAIKSRMSKDTPITVLFHGGTYKSTKTVKFDKNDSGTDAAPITYAAYNNENVIFSGAYDLDVSKFRAVTDEKVLARLPVEARGKVGELDLTSVGVQSIPAFPFTRYSGEAYQENLYIKPTYAYTGIFLNGNEQQIARWPNDGYTQFGKLHDKGSVESGVYKDPMVFGYFGSRPDGWRQAKDAIVEGYFNYEYSFERVPLVSVDPEKRTISAGHFSAAGVTEGNRWAVINLLEEIDSPGEWYIDRQNMVLYYYPPYTLNNSEMKMSTFQDTMITIDNASNIKFLGLTFRDTCGNVFDMESCSNIEITSCKLTNIGRRGIVIKNGLNNTIKACDISYVGGISVHMNGGNRQTLTPGNNKVINCHFYALSRETKTYAPAINTTGVGNIIENNLIHNGPHQAIMFSGNDHKILYNEIYDVVKEAADSAAIYAGREWTMRGTEIAYNYIHDIIKDPGITHPVSAIGIYLDDMLSGIDVHHNIFNNTDLAYLLNCGQDNRFENNIILNSTTAMVLSNWGETSGRKGMMPGSGSAHYVGLSAVPYNKPPYSTKYPGLLHLFDFFPGSPRGSYVKNNIIYASGKVRVETESYVKYGTLENNIEVKEDPGFIDSESNNFNIKHGSEILEKVPGFTDIPIEKIGIYKDEYRTDLGDLNTDFKQTYPKNGQTAVDALNTVFKWENVYGADRYNITIATDSNLKDVVFTGQSPTNFISVKGLKSEKTSYYWKVEAVNTSYNNSTNLSKGAPYLFTTSFYEYLKKDELKFTIKRAEEVLLGIEEGVQPGQYKEGTKAEIQKALQEAKNAVNITLCLQSVMDDAEKALTGILAELPSKIKNGYAGVDDMVKDAKDWVAAEGSIKINNDELTFSAHEAAAGYSKEFMKNYALYCFKFNADFGTGWVGFGLKQTKPDKFAWANKSDSYLFVIKRDMIELQRSTGGNNEMLATIPNTFIKDKEWQDVQIGTINVQGGVRLIFKVDGKVVFEHTDSAKALTDPGYFVLYNPGNSVSIKPTDNMPQGDLEISTVEK